jgi:hypothetical protein
MKGRILGQSVAQGLALLALSLPAILLVPVAAPMSAPARAGELERPQMLSGLIGSWRGRGKAIARAGGTPEAVNCRARYSWVSRPNERLQGIITCSASSAKSRVSIYIGHDSDTGALGGTFIQKWGTSDVEEFGDFQGRQTGPGTFQFAIIAGGKPRARLVLSLEGDNRYSAEVKGVVDGEEQQAFSVVFSR